MTTPTISIISLGCSKNLVDSERLLKMLTDAGLKVMHDCDEADIIVINTCGFIGDAKEESIEEILRFISLKESGDIQQLYVMGCLSERYRKELIAEMPEVDGWFGKFDWPGLVETLSHKKELTSPFDRIITTGPHHAYLKIAEGCNRFCAFCAIPLITGRYKSRPEEEILDEVKHLVSLGVKEFNVIAQDLSNYGKDLHGELRLPHLVDKMAQIDGVKWIRLHYAYPTEFPHDILDVIARHPNVCNYLDIALQHISDSVLSNMRRHITGAETRELLAEMRRRVPGLHIRTTLMVGFPGEGEKEFEELKEFVREQRFERMGAFAYCVEDDTYAAKNFKDDIPQEVKELRLAELMEIQEEIALEENQKKVGKTFEVVIDREEEDFYIGRTQFDSPEVDPEVLIKKSVKLKIGEFYNVTISDALPFELIGEVVNGVN